MTAGRLDAGALDAGLAARIEADRRDRIERIGAEPVAWLALAPEWTRRVAAAAGFPGLDAVLSEAVDAGWCVAERHRLDRRGALVRARLLATTIRELPPATSPWLRHQLCAEVLAAVPQIGSDTTKATLLAQIARGLPADLTATARDVAAAVTDPAQRAYALAVTGGDASTVDSLAAEDRMRVAAVLGRSADVAAAAMQCAAPYAELVQLLGDVPAAVLAPAVAAVEAVPSTQDDAAAWTGPSTQDDPADRAAVLAATAALLPADTAERAQAAVEASLTGVHPSIAALILVDLAAFAAARGRADDALGFAERILDEGLRMEAYAAAVRAHPPLAPRVAALAEPVARAAAETAEPGQEGCVALVETLCAAGEARAAEGIAALLTDRRGHPDAIASLARAAVALRTAGRSKAADRVVRAITAADLGEDLTLQATAWLRSLPAFAPPDVTGVADMARIAAERAEEPDAAVLARLLPYVHHTNTQPLLRRVLELTAPAGSDAGFWMPDAARPDVLAALAASHGTAWLRAQAVTAAGRLRSPEVQALAVPATLRQWANLAGTAQDPSGAATARRLEAACGPLLESGAVGEALGWVGIARLLLPVIGGELETSVLLVSRRAELVQRREQDRRHLERFLVRRGPVEEFDQLLARPDDGQWALHYLGQGGIGKTTLLRYLTARLAPERGVITSRVDFDHLDPDYPLRRPGQLLLELLQELGAHAAAGGADTLFRRVDRQLRDLRHWAPDDTALNALAALDSPAMRAAIGGFCEFLRLLPHRVVLVLDTCEEVAKFRPEAGRMPQLVAMFTLLERIHAAVPSMRVVLAGRRPLVRDGAGGVSPLPAAQAYLRVAEVRGFSRAEAERYVAERVGLTLPDDDLDRLLALCPEPVPRPDEVRYSPFDLAQHAAAVREDPGYLDALGVSSASGVDPYIEHRIMRRLREPARGLLAAVVALRRFDREMLDAAATELHRDRLAEAWFELAATEWLEYRVHPPLDTPFLEVHGSLLERLERYFERYPQHHEQLEAHRALGLRLPDLVDGRPLDRLRVEHVDAAVRCAPPDRAAVLCDTLARRVVSEQAWGWAETVFARILSADGALTDVTHPATAAARALYAAAAGKISAAAPLVPIWTEVADAVAGDPAAGWLRLRAEHAAIGRGADRRPALPALLAAASVAVPAGTPHIDPAPPAPVAPPPLRLPAALGVAGQGQSLLSTAGLGQSLFGVGGVGTTSAGISGPGTPLLGGAGLAAPPPELPVLGTAVGAVLGVPPGAAAGAVLGRWTPGKSPQRPAATPGNGRERAAPPRQAPPGEDRATSAVVRALAISVRDGRAVVVAGDAAGTLRSWDFDDARAVTPPRRAHAGPVLAVATLELGGRPVAVSGGADGCVRWWPVEPGPAADVPVLRGAGAVTGLATIDGDERPVVAVLRDGRVRLWPAGAPDHLAREVAFPSTPATAIAAAAPDPSSTRPLLVMGSGAGVYLVDPQTGTSGLVGDSTTTVRAVAVTVAGGDREPFAVVATADGARVHQVGGDGAGHVRKLAGADVLVHACTIAPDGSWFATGDADGALRLWDAGSGEPLRVLRSGGAVLACAVSPDGTWIAAAGGDDAALLWDAGTGRPLATLRGHEGGVWGCAAGSDATWVVTADGAGVLRRYASAGGPPVWAATHDGGLRGCAVAPDGSLVAVGAAGGAVHVHDAQTGALLHTLAGHPGGTWACAVAPDGTWLATAGADGAVRLWDAATGAPLRTLTGAVGPLWGCAIAPDGTWLAAAGNDGTVRIWSATGEPGLVLTGHAAGVWGCAIAPDGTWLTAGGRDVRAWDASTGRRRLAVSGAVPEAGPATAVAAGTLDGRPIALTGAADGRIHAWDLRAGVPLGAPVAAHTGSVTAIALATVRGRTIAATGGADGTVRFWDLAEGWRRTRLLLGDALAAVSARLDQIERSPDRDVRDLGVGRAQVDELAALAEACGAAAYARMLRARLAWLSGDVDEADRLAGDALGALPEDPSAPLDPFVGADWDAPAVTADRVRLELARLTGRPLPHPEPALLLDAAARAANPDADRLASITLLHMLAHAVVERSTVEAVQTALGSTVTPPATVAAHEAVPPLRVALARAWAALGAQWEVRAALDRAWVTDKPTMDVFDDALLDLSVRLGRSDWGRHLRQVMTSPAAVRAQLLFSSSPYRPPDPYPHEREEPAPLEWWWQHRNEPMAAARRALLDAALFGDGEPPVLDWVEPVLGARRIAELALEEGQPLAAYRPTSGERLLQWAAGWFHDLGERPTDPPPRTAPPTTDVPASSGSTSWMMALQVRLLAWEFRSWRWWPAMASCGVVAPVALGGFLLGAGWALLPIAVLSAAVPVAGFALDWMWAGLPRWSRTWRRTPQQIFVTVSPPGAWTNPPGPPRLPRVGIEAAWDDPPAAARVAVHIRFDDDDGVPAWPRWETRRAAALLTSAGSAGLPVLMEVDRMHAAASWEAALTQGAGKMLDTRRVLSGEGTTSPGEPGWTVLAGPIRRTVLQETMSAQLATGPPNAVGTGLLVLAGLTVLVDGQPRIAVEALTVHPDDLPMDKLRLILVVADATEPGRDNMLLRVCCADLMQAGAAAVVLVPAMPLEHLGPVLAPFAALTNIPAAVRAARGELARRTGPVYAAEMTFFEAQTGSGS